MDYHLLLVQHLALIDRVVRFVARRHHLSMSDAEEFAGHVRYKLVDRDFAVLRKFEGRSALNTYLTVVIDRLCLDFCVAKWGKWRPSAAARRLGPVAIRLEQLLVREGLTFDEAVGTLQTNHSVSETRAELHALLLQLPVAGSRSVSGHPDAGERTVAAVGPLDLREDERTMARLQLALVAAFATLPADDRELVRLRFEQGLGVADIARARRVEVKPLYRRFEGIIRALRSELLQRGVDESDLAHVIGHPTLMLSGVLADRPPP